MKLYYAGLPHAQTQRVSAQRPLRDDIFNDVPLRPGECLAFFHLDGPAIVRELHLEWPRPANLRLLIRYEDEDSFAVDAPLERFFGSFQGVSLDSSKSNHAVCYLPLPFQKNCDVLLRNEGEQTVRLSGKAVVESIPVMDAAWGYFHALYQKTEKTNGHRLHQVLYTRGRGHWLGMALYNTGHDHGGGDFAVIDGESPHPQFLHGVNGEDYFTFAWFGKGAHHPYAVAHTNEAGRYRHHFENVYPFSRSIAVDWGAFADLSPESVAYWYQDSPRNLTLHDGALSVSKEWDVFGPVPIPHNEQEKTQGGLFDGLPSIADLDAGKTFECRLVQEHFTSGWMKEWSVGPMLNLTYLARHGTPIGYEAELGGMGHAYLARRFVESLAARNVFCQFAHDDPVEVWINGERVYERERMNGFQPTVFPMHLQEGKNEVVVKLTNYFNRDFNWAGFWMRGLD